MFEDHGVPSEKCTVTEYFRQCHSCSGRWDVDRRPFGGCRTFRYIVALSARDSVSFEPKNKHRAASYFNTATSKSTGGGIAVFVLKIEQGNPSNCCPLYESLDKHARRSRGELTSRYSMTGSQDKTPNFESKGEGWSVGLRGKADKKSQLTAGILVVSLPEDCYIDTDRNTFVLSKRDCDTEKDAQSRRPISRHRKRRCGEGRGRVGRGVYH